MNSIEIRAICGLGMVFSLRMLGMFMVLPILTTYGMMLKEANETLIGLAVGICGLTQVIFQIPFGLASDHIGRKPIIIIGLLIFAFGSTIAALTDNIWGVIFGRALQGSGAISATVMALLSDLTSEKNRTKAMAFIGIGLGITFAIAIVIGPIITYRIGLSGLFLIITVLSFIGIIITVLVVPTSVNHTLNYKLDTIYGSFSKVLVNSQLLKLNYSIFCLHAILMSNFVVLPSMMTTANFLPADQWQIYLVTMLISFAMVFPTVFYAEIKHKIKRIFLSCILLLFLAQLLLLVAEDHLWTIFIGIQILFLAFNIMEVLLPSLISKESPANYKGTAMGIYSTSQFLGVAFGGIMGGYLCQYQGVWLVFLICSIIILAWWIISMTLCEPLYDQ